MRFKVVCSSIFRISYVNKGIKQIDMISKFRVDEDERKKIPLLKENCGTLMDGNAFHARG